MENEANELRAKVLDMNQESEELKSEIEKLKKLLLKAERRNTIHVD